MTLPYKTQAGICSRIAMMRDLNFHSIDSSPSSEVRLACLPTFLVCLRHRILALVPALALMAGVSPAAYAATINLTPADDLQTVINSATSGDTISLTADYTYHQGLEIEGKNITFGLNGHNLNIANDTGIGLSKIGLLVHGGSKVDYTGAGSFTASFTSASTDGLAIDVEDPNSSCTLTGVQMDAAGGGNTVYSDLGAAVIVNGNVSAQGAGNRGVFAQGGSSVTVNGNVTAASGHSVDAENAGTSITVNGNVSLLGGYHLDAIYADGGAAVTVNGNVIAGEPVGSSVIWGIEAYDNATVILVTGSMTIADGGIYVDKNAKATINGPVNAKFTQETPAGVDARGGAEILLKSDVTVNVAAGPGFAGVAAHENGGIGGTVTIDGVLTATPYIDIEGNILTAADISTPTTKTGYDTYTDGNSTVWVKTPTTTTTISTAVPALNPAALILLAALMGWIALLAGKRKAE